MGNPVLLQATTTIDQTRSFTIIRSSLWNARFSSLQVIILSFLAFPCILPAGSCTGSVQSYRMATPISCAILNMKYSTWHCIYLLLWSTALEFVLLIRVSVTAHRALPTVSSFYGSRREFVRDALPLYLGATAGSIRMSSCSLHRTHHLETNMCILLVTTFGLTEERRASRHIEHSQCIGYDYNATIMYKSLSVEMCKSPSNTDDYKAYDTD